MKINFNNICCLVAGKKKKCNVKIQETTMKVLKFFENDVKIPSDPFS